MCPNDNNCEVAYDFTLQLSLSEDSEFLKRKKKKWEIDTIKQRKSIQFANEYSNM